MASFWGGFAKGFTPAWESSRERASRRRERAADRAYAEKLEKEKLKAQAGAYRDIAHAEDERIRKEEHEGVFPPARFPPELFPFVPTPAPEEEAQTEVSLAMRDAITEKHKITQMIRKADATKAANIAATLAAERKEGRDIQEKQFDQTFGFNSAKDKRDHERDLKRRQWDRGKFQRELELATKYKRKIEYDDAKELVNSVRTATSPFAAWVKARTEGTKLYDAVISSDPETESRALIINLAEGLEAIKAKWLAGDDGLQAKTRNASIVRQRDIGMKDIALLYKSYDPKKEPDFNPEDLIERVTLNSSHVVVPFVEADHSKAESWRRIIPAQRNRAMQTFQQEIEHKLDPKSGVASEKSYITAPVRLLPGESTDPIRGGGWGAAVELNRAYLEGGGQITKQEVEADGRLSPAGHNKVIKWLRDMSFLKESDQPTPKAIRNAASLLLPERELFFEGFSPFDWDKLDTAEEVLEAVDRFNRIEKMKDDEVGTRIKQGGRILEKQKDGTWVEVKD